MANSTATANYTFETSSQNKAESAAGWGDITTTIFTNVKIFVFVYQWLIMPFILVLNIISIIVCIKSNSHSLRMRANEFVLSLAVADFVIGLVIPYFSIVYIHPAISYSLIYCGFRFCLNQAHSLAAVLSIFLVTTDRYVAVVHPMIYYRTDFLPFSRQAIFIVWFYSLFSGFIPFFWNKGMAHGCTFIFFEHDTYYYAFWAAPLFCSCLTMTVMYARIFYVASQQENRIVLMLQNLEHKQRQKDYHRTKRDRKYSKVMAVVLGAFFICWGPMTVLSIFEYNGFYTTPAEIVRLLAVSMSMTNSVINPLIYVWNIPEFRIAFQKFFRITSKVVVPIQAEISIM